MIDEHIAVYGIVLILALSVALSLDARSATGLAKGSESDQKIKILSAMHESGELNVVFSATSSKSVSVSFIKFDIEYPGGERKSFAKFVQSSSLDGKEKLMSLPLESNEEGIYHLKAFIDPYKNVHDANRENNKDEIIFNV